jgi:HD superfamily phosphohydrolase
LIHDVSHGAFSHCLDYVFDEGSQKEQTHQDNIFEKFVKESGIPRILETYGIDINYVVDDKNFPLKERLLPDLCADRIDYILR